MLLLNLLRKEKAFEPLLAALQKEKKPVLVTGIASAAKELFPAAVLQATGEKALLLFPDEAEAMQVHKALSSVIPGTLFFPARDFSLVRMDSSSRDFSARRLQVLGKLAAGEWDCIVTTFEAACQATLPPEVMARCRKSLSVGDPLEKDELIRLLSDAGYAFSHRVEGAGQYAARGDIVDVFLSGEENPFRIEFFGDEIDAIGSFDPVTQRRIENAERIVLSPASEINFSSEERSTVCAYLREEAEKSRPEEKEKRVFIRSLLERIEAGMDFAKDLFLPLIYRFSTLLDYTGDQTVFLYGQSEGKAALEVCGRMLEEELKSLFEENKTLLPPEDIRLLLDFDELCTVLSQRRTLLMENFFAGKSKIPPSGIFSFVTRTSSRAFRDLEGLLQDVEELQEEGYRTLILCDNSLSAGNLYEYFSAAGKKAQRLTGEEEEVPDGVLGILSRSAAGGELIRDGFELSDSKIALLRDTETFAEKGKKKKKTRDHSGVKASAKQKLLSYQDLAVGDYVVHVSHGIGVFRGVEKMRSADGSQKDFIKISYAGSDVLYVPCANLDSVSKYIGPKSDSGALKLNKLGGNEWQKATSRAKAGAKDIAKKLIALYAQRQKMQSYAFSPDTTWQQEFEDAFPYGETDSQLRATAEIKADMEKPIPMDRLLCGDVGFGKTEVALRGVFKCVMDGKQAAILVPTTILAWQHFQTVLSRFRGYPVKVEMLSRFRTKKEQTQILKKLAEGQIDVLVGTHRLLQQDVKFADLGFLVIDEEQRFGVTHKERLKELSRGVDVLTLTATPIPRTMNMALSGIKDMSLLEEAPEDRFPVQTYVLEYDRGLILEAIRRELRRGGQVFYLHNNIEELQAVQPWLQREFPDASIAVGHGKMDKDSLSDIWKDMMDKEVDILLCTTIIETGVDLPDANTLIVECADHFGLSQLHQIRGRVGRSDRKAYAYLTYRKGKTLSEVSVKRLEAIREYTEFGAGFQIALRDLEIRGAGNLLGAEQSGHLDSIGYDMYMKILNDAVLEEKGEKVETTVECVVDLAMDGFIPEKYVPYPAERMDLYRKIASLRNQEDALDLTDEMLDRFGDLPRSVTNLFSVALLRAKAEETGCVKISQSGTKLTFIFETLSEEAMLLQSAVYASRLTLSFSGKPSMVLQLKYKEDALEACNEFFGHLSGFLETIRQNQN